MLTIISSHYKEDLSHLKKSKYPVVVYTHNKDFNDKDFNYKIIPNIGLDPSAYMNYIVDNYDNLPEKMAFIHGHEMSYHQNDTILNVIENKKHMRYASLSSIPTYTLSNSAPAFGSPSFDREGYRKIKCAWPYIIKDAPFPEIIIFKPCPQFIITRDIILNNKKQFYIDILDWIYNNNNVPAGWVPYVIEYLYHYIFFKSLYYFELK